jgi:hypothetical protein
VVLREASLPDLRIVCGTPAHGKVYRAKFEPYHFPAWHVPVFYDTACWVFGTRYMAKFPFCSICTPENFDIQTTRINKKAGFFRHVSNTFLKLLPGIPPDLAGRLQSSWPQRVFRFFMR